MGIYLKDTCTCFIKPPMGQSQFFNLYKPFFCMITYLTQLIQIKNHYRFLKWKNLIHTSSKTNSIKKSITLLKVFVVHRRNKTI